MPVTWNLREYLRERGLIRASHVSKIIHERTGYLLSTQAVCDLLNDQPKMLRVETSQALCDAFYCNLSDFFEVKPRAACRSQIKNPRLPEPRSSQGLSMLEAEQGAGKDATQDQRPPRDRGPIDFAAFFPDARKFSS
jgi:DNA-binding Xre family transcriptional regulator